MKYWKELNELEEAVYQIKVIQSGLNLISESEQFTCYQPSDITQSFQTFVLDLNERMNDAVQKLDEKFNKVWDTVRDDTGRLGAAEEDTVPPWEEDLEAIKSLEEEHEASIRFEKIISNMPELKIVKDEVYFDLSDTMANTDYHIAGMNDTYDTYKIEPLDLNWEPNDNHLSEIVTLGNLDEYLKMDFTYDPASKSDKDVLAQIDLYEKNA